MQSVNEEQPTRSSPSVLAFMMVIPLLIYAPLIASLIEDQLLSTNHVYEFFDRIGLADSLDVIYTPLTNLFNL